MKKSIPYIAGSVLLIAIVVLLITSNNKSSQKTFDGRITLRRQDKIPYGTWVAFQDLKYIFPKATIHTNRYEPGYWDSVSVYKSGQAFISISTYFNPDEYEMKRLIRFAENGNDVFISTRELSYDARKIINYADDQSEVRTYYRNGLNYDYSDSLTVSLVDPPYRDGYKEYKYPGQRLIGFFEKINLSTTDILGTDEEGAPYFIHLRAGKGNFYVHLAPLTFSNYFLLHKDNMEYYEKALSVISPDVTKVLWDEYYLFKRNPGENTAEKKSWLTVLFRYPAMRAALLTAILTLLVYTLIEMRRKQRYIPVVAKPRNDSLDFVKTIGRLYFDKGDHKNLCRKMTAYFLEYVRNRYKLPTGTMDENFINQLRFKSGAEESEIRGIVSFIKYIDDAPVIVSKDVNEFHKQLESFYKKA